MIIYESSKSDCHRISVLGRVESRPNTINLLFRSCNEDEL
jgi:hypothetical protein